MPASGSRAAFRLMQTNRNARRLTETQHPGRLQLGGQGFRSDLATQLGATLSSAIPATANTDRRNSNSTSSNCSNSPRLFLAPAGQPIRSDQPPKTTNLRESTSARPRSGLAKIRLGPNRGVHSVQPNARTGVGLTCPHYVDASGACQAVSNGFAGFSRFAPSPLFSRPESRTPGAPRR